MIRPEQLMAVSLRRPFAAILRPNQFHPSRVSVRAKSLSAIHRGLRGSEYAQYGAIRPRETSSYDRRRRDPSQRGPRRNPSVDREPRDQFFSKFATTRALDGASNYRQQQKLRKKLAKKKAEEEDEDENNRQTRRKRFTDPESNFGKKSLVYRLKFGDLKEKAGNLNIEEPVKPRSFRDARRDSSRLERQFREEREPRLNRDEPRRTEPWNNNREEPRRNERWEDRERGSGRDNRRSDRDGESRRTERWGNNRDGESRHNERWGDRERGSGRNDRRGDRDGDSKRTERWGNNRDGESRHNERWNSNRDGESRRSERWGERDGESRDGSDSRPARKRTMMPMTVKYTTAASQFLYGKSVVKSALEQGRRKLYNLYIYGGDNRRDSTDNTIMTRLAKKHGIPVTIVPNEEQRIMDKMSMGRPHNGFVLEASPLPQRPIQSLGRLEETATKLGFHVVVDFQTKEEESINGTDTFVKRANDTTPKPFVLLLNEILDPGNLGGILRTASYLGIDAVGITSRGSSTLTPVVLKSAAGAVEEVTLFTVDDPLKFMEDSSKAGWKTFAAVAPPDKKLVRRHGEKFISTDEIQAKSPLSEHPCLLVLGNEGHGLPKQLKVAADYELSVPSFVRSSNVDSLNVSVAAGLLCHSFIKEIKASEDNALGHSQKIIDLVRNLGRRNKKADIPEVLEVESVQEEKSQEEPKRTEGQNSATSEIEENRVEEKKVEEEKGEGKKAEPKKADEKKVEESDLGF
ncbi:hypothetical protein B0T10DRAFT_469022 [Thelonectria olida]|uniref:rRNA methyltransferase 1, mitochondrial n=1 Tax=Thelonectria olida TaxID=1576542 RepID=A0A9P9ATI0_9HYPO|nr:hypothetical protein B0T10DRAFT_469022 [Thelonectria olida]